MTIIDVPEPTTVVGKSYSGEAPVVGGGGSVSTQYAQSDAVNPCIQYQETVKWANAKDGATPSAGPNASAGPNSDGGCGSEPPTYPGKFRASGKIRLAPFTVTGTRATQDLKVFPRDVLECSAGYDYYLLQKMIDGRDLFWEEAVQIGKSDRRTVTTIVNS